MFLNYRKISLVDDNITCFASIFDFFDFIFIRFDQMIYLLKWLFKYGHFSTYKTGVKIDQEIKILRILIGVFLITVTPIILF